MRRTAIAMMVLTGLACSSTADNAVAHGKGECYESYAASAPWPATRKITKDETVWMATKHYNYCRFIGMEGSNLSRVVFWDWINNTAALAIAISVNGQKHVVKVDHDQTFANGRWFGAFNLSLQPVN